TATPAPAPPPAAATAPAPVPPAARPPARNTTAPATTAPPTTTAPSRSTTLPVRQIAAPPPAKADHAAATGKQRRWALSVLILVVGAGSVTAALKRRRVR